MTQRTVFTKQNQFNDIDHDPVAAAFLAFLERDMIEHPGNIQPITETEITRLRALTRYVVVSDDDVIPDNVTL